MTFEFDSFLLCLNFDFLINGFGLGVHVELPHKVYIGDDKDGFDMPFDLILVLGPLEFGLSIVGLKNEEV